MKFSEALDAIQCVEGAAEFSVSDQWRQGRAIFGGLQGAAMLKAMRSLVSDVPLRSLQVTFVAPPKSDAIQVTANLVRQGKSATHVQAQLTDGDAVLAMAVGVFGSARPSDVVRTPVMPEVQCETPKRMRYIPGISPTFTQHFNAVWLKGRFPFAGAQEPETIIDLSMPEEASSTEYHVVAMADYIPPIGLTYLSKLCAGSSLTWMLEFLSEDVNGLSMENWRVDAAMVAASDGYTNQSVMIWGPQGQPLALSRQSMVVFG